MSVHEQIVESESLIQWLDAKIDGLEIQADLRSRIAGGCLDVVLEHQKGIVLLVSERIYASAFGLVRLIFEAYVRGIWLHQCATQQDLNRFEKNKLDKTFDNLIQEIEKLDGFNNVDVLSKVKNASWAAMNSYTHTGFHQVVRRNRDSTIEPDYSENEIIEVVSFANAIGVLAAIEIARLARNEILANEVLEKAQHVLRPSR